MKNLRKDWLLKIHLKVRRSRLNIYTQQKRAINTTERSNVPAMSAKTRLFKEGFFKLVDLSVLESCLEVSYVLSRFGGYGYEIVEVLDMMGSISECDKTVVTEAAKVTSEMISLSVNALDFKDKQASDKLYEINDTVDLIYRKYMQEIVTAKKESKNMYADPRCVISLFML